MVYCCWLWRIMPPCVIKQSIMFVWWNMPPLQISLIEFTGHHWLLDKKIIQDWKQFSPKKTMASPTSTVLWNISSPSPEKTSAQSLPTPTIGFDVDSYEQTYNTALAILFSGVIFFGVLLNSIIVFTVYRWPEMRTPCNLLIVNIAVGDLAVASLGAPLRIIEAFVGWPFGNFLCSVLLPLLEMFVTVSVVTHTTIALERFRAIVRPLKTRLSLRNTKLVIFAIWPACYVASALPIAPVLKVQEIDGLDRCYPQWPFELYRPIYQVYLVTLFIAVPLVIQTMAYFRIMKALQNRLTPMCAMALDRNILSRAIQYQKRRRVIKTLAIMVFAFQVCYIPRAVMLMFYEFGIKNVDWTSFKYADLVILIIYYLKHVLNPIILFASSRDFQRWSCLQIFCRWYLCMRQKRSLLKARDLLHVGVFKTDRNFSSTI